MEKSCQAMSDRRISYSEQVRLVRADLAESEKRVLHFEHQLTILRNIRKQSLTRVASALPDALKALRVEHAAQIEQSFDIDMVLRDTSSDYDTLESLIT